MVQTKGGIVVENINIGDIHYEFAYIYGIKCEVISLPVKGVREDGDEYWTWKSKNCVSGRVINYGISKKYSHLGPNLYDYEAYFGITCI